MDAVRLRARYMILLAAIGLVALALPHRRHHHRHHYRTITSRCTATEHVRIPAPGPSEIERIYRHDRELDRGTYDAYRRPH